MPDRSSLGIALVVVGLGLVAVGALFWLGLLSWFGRLPGDMRVERPGFRFYAPITTMVIVSVLLTLVMTIIRRWWP